MRTAPAATRSWPIAWPPDAVPVLKIRMPQVATGQSEAHVDTEELDLLAAIEKTCVWAPRSRPPPWIT